MTINPKTLRPTLTWWPLQGTASLRETAADWSSCAALAVARIRGGRYERGVGKGEVHLGKRGV